jgi:hypothetical protein
MFRYIVFIVNDEAGAGGQEEFPPDRAAFKG